MKQEAKVTIALAGNPNAGKTTLFNALTGSNQFVGNWPGVTVEKKEGFLKGQRNVTVTDLPGIYSLSPYTMEEIVARNYLVQERPNVILNIVDGTNLERNLYLTTQLIELNIPIVVAINMIDVVQKQGDKINVEKLSNALGCPVVEISALKGKGIEEAAKTAIDAAGKNFNSSHKFSPITEKAIENIEKLLPQGTVQKLRRWYAVKLFENDEKANESIKLSPEQSEKIKSEIAAVETALDDQSESIIADERYTLIGKIVDDCYKRKSKHNATVSDKIDRIVTNRFLALPIFVLIMFCVYFISVSTVGQFFTDRTNDGIFGDGIHFLGIGSKQYETALDEYAQNNFTDELKEIVNNAVNAEVVGASDIADAIESGSYADFEEAYGTYGDSLAEAGFDISVIYEAAFGDGAQNIPDPYDYGLFIPSVPDMATNLLEKIHCAPWLESLLVDGIIGGVGAVLGFLPQMIVLFLLLALLEACGYMARIAFVLDRVFHRFGLSGKSFIPMLIGSGCGVPGIMASRTIENEKDRKMTIITTTFMPCGAKLPIIALIAQALFNGAWWVAPSAYFIGIAAIIVSGIILKKTKLFASDPTPFVMELPPYRMPSPSNVFRSVWERGSSFIKKAGTIILLASIVIWLGSHFGIMDSRFMFSTEMELESSVLGYLSKAVCWIFAPLGFGNAKATIATVMGLVAKEEVVGVFGVLDFENMTKLSAYSFLVFNLLCAPCFAAMGAIKREMNSSKWTAFAIGYQCVFAYAISFMLYQLGSIFTKSVNPLGVIVAVALFGFMIYMLFFKKYYRKKTFDEVKK